VWRVVIYAREATGRAGRARLDRQVGQLAAQVAREPDWQHIATYTDQCTGVRGERQGLRRLLADAPTGFDVVVVDGYGQLSQNRRELHAILDRLTAAGVATILLRPSAGRRFAKAVANFALADLIGQALR
jgi:DNA invertase Pin-like site-specific DNA recombinase